MFKASIKKIPHCLLYSYLTVSVSTASAENQKAHVHGAAKLTLASEDKMLEVEFESPAYNLLGFEHKAQQAKEKQLVHRTEEALKTSNLFVFEGTECTSIEIGVDLSNMLADDHDKGHDHDEEIGRASCRERVYAPV